MAREYFFSEIASLWRSITVAFVVRERIQLVVGDARRLGLILVERHSLVAVLQFLDLQRVRGIVHQYGRIAADIHEMDHVFFDILVERADFAVPAQPLGIGAERFNHKARPRLGVKSGAGSPEGMKPPHSPDRKETPFTASTPYTG